LMLSITFSWRCRFTWCPSFFGRIWNWK
jgi:hypothetical protein